MLVYPVALGAPLEPGTKQVTKTPVVGDNKDRARAKTTRAEESDSTDEGVSIL